MTDPKFMKFHWTELHQSSQSNHNGYQRHHPNDETVPMDVDTPVFTMVRCAHSEADKARFKRKGRCFSCNKQGHMAKDCPNQKKQFNLPRQFSRFDQSSSRSDQVRSVLDIVNHLPDRATPSRKSPLISRSAPQGLESIINPLCSNILRRHAQPILRKSKKKKDPKKRTYPLWPLARLDYLKISVING